MENENIILEFKKLIAFINEKSSKDEKSTLFRLKQLKNILLILKKYPKKITLDELSELKELPGIGKGSIDRIKEILQTGKLSELNNFVDTSKEKVKALEDLESVVGIGEVKALELYNSGITSVIQLKKMFKEKKIELNEKIELGLKYYKKFQGNIPRAEIKKIYKIIEQIIKQLNKTEDKDEEYIFEICGSYRREKTTSNDIDILVSKKGKLDKKYNYLENLVKILKEPIKKNDNKPLLIDDMTDKNIHTKYMGFGKFLNNPPRRIDIRFVPYESWFSALLYFTGSAEHNKKMRSVAISKKLKLSEYGLTKENGEKLNITSERDLFDKLEMEYLLPKLR
jgi:hypothetical protein